MNESFSFSQSQFSKREREALNVSLSQEISDMFAYAFVSSRKNTDRSQLLDIDEEVMSVDIEN